ncbi:unnamed protein product [Closterium sp. NIES-54]
MVTTTTPGGQRVSICTCTQTGRHQATLTCRLGLSLYTLTTEPAQVVASGKVSASGQVAAPCSCRLLSHQTLLWHHRLGHPSLPRLRGMHSRLLRADPHSSFPPTTAPLQTLHMDVWDPARVSGQSRERYFLPVVDDYTRYTTVFPLRSKGEVPDVLIPWICAVRLQLRERTFGGPAAGGTRSGGSGATSPEVSGDTAGAGGTGGAGAAGPGGAHTRGNRAGGAGAGGTGAGDPRAGGIGAGDPRNGGAGAGDFGSRGTRVGDP